MNYSDFLKSKEYKYEPTGFDIELSELNEKMFEFQKQITKWAIKKGRCALFLDTGLGKTICQLEFANQVCKRENGKALILAPLAVSLQTIKEGKRFGIEVNQVRKQADVKQGINITNYEMVEHFDPSSFVCVVLDESSIIKHFMSKTAAKLIEDFRYTKYKLACTATPSPNDHQELGTHSEFLNIMTRTEMLSMFFINDAKEQHWRMKRHAESRFWEWVSQWAIVLKTPKDIGHKVAGYDLPKLNITVEQIESDYYKGEFIPSVAKTLEERREVRKHSLPEKITKIQEMLNTMDNCLIWCDYNDESAAIAKINNDITEVKGSDTVEHKEKSMIGFADGEIKFLVSKPSICGFGMNFQNCNNMIFCGLSDSYERFYQAIRRCWRYGQHKPVNVYVVLSESEIMVLKNIQRKEKQHEQMTKNMVKYTKVIVKAEITATERLSEEYIAEKNIIMPEWLTA